MSEDWDAEADNSSQLKSVADGQSTALTAGMSSMGIGRGKWCPSYAQGPGGNDFFGNSNEDNNGPSNYNQSDSGGARGDSGGARGDHGGARGDHGGARGDRGGARWDRDGARGNRGPRFDGNDQGSYSRGSIRGGFNGGRNFNGNNNGQEEIINGSGARDGVGGGSGAYGNSNNEWGSNDRDSSSWNNTRGSARGRSNSRGGGSYGGNRGHGGNYTGNRGGFNSRNFGTDNDGDDVPSGGRGGANGTRGTFRRDNSNNGYSERDGGGQYGGGNRDYRGGHRGGGAGGAAGYRRNEQNGQHNESEGEDRNQGSYRGHRDGGFRGGGRRGGVSDRSGGGRDYNDGDNKDDGDRGGFADSGGQGGGGGGYHKGGANNGDGQDEGGENKQERPPLYIPKDKTDNEVESNSIPSGINFSKYENIPVEVTGNNWPQPIVSFEESNLRDHLLRNVKRSNYTIPTPIQKYAIPAIMAGRDVMSCAQTGSGKTAAFLLPMLNKMMEMAVPIEAGGQQKLLGLIISPTRELADQIDTEARKFARDSMIKVCVIYGGASRGYQFRNVERGVHLLVATPGRLKDFLSNNKFSFENLQFLVLDEADRMLDMGFKDDIGEVLKHPSMPKKGNYQTLMFSATFPPDIQTLALNMLDDYIFIVIGKVGGANEDIEQYFYQLNRFEKRKQLQEIVGNLLHDNFNTLLMAGLTNKDIDEKTMIFVAMKKNTDFIATLLSQKNIPSTSIHGDRLQEQREQALRDFRYGTMKCIVCTDVAARGLDIKGVDHVINYDMPKNIDDYVHRIGRTGRVGNIGKATSFYDPDTDYALASGLVKLLADAHKEVPDFLQNAGGMHSGGGSASGGGRFASRDIRDPREFGHQSNTDHYETNPPDSGKLNDEAENWDV